MALAGALVLVLIVLLLLLPTWIRDEPAAARGRFTRVFDVSPGTTGTHGVFDALCQSGHITIHWKWWCTPCTLSNPLRPKIDIGEYPKGTVFIDMPWWAVVGVVVVNGSRASG